MPATQSYTLPGGALGFHDWGVVRRGNWSFDVTYFIVGALDVADRQAHAARLVERYGQAFVDLDTPSALRSLGA